MIPEQKRLEPISQDIILSFVDHHTGDAADGLDSTLIYDPSDPYSMTIVFRSSTDEVRWTFARDLLLDGVYEPTGDGDVHIWPCVASDGTAVVIVELCSPDGEIVVQAYSREAISFVWRMLSLIPRHAEMSMVNVDDELTRLLDT